MITKRIATEIAHLSLNPIMERLSETAKQQVIDGFCQPNCGHSSEGSFCPDACITYGELLKHLFEGHASLN